MNFKLAVMSTGYYFDKCFETKVINNKQLTTLNNDHPGDFVTSPMVN